MAGFKPGESGNPAGRPKGAGGGRTLALANLDKMLAQSRNQAMLLRAMEEEFKRDPVRFFRTMVMPLLPREAKLAIDNEGVVQWKSLLGGSAEQVDGGRLGVDAGEKTAVKGLTALPEGEGEDRTQCGATLGEGSGR